MVSKEDGRGRYYKRAERNFGVKVMVMFAILIMMMISRVYTMSKFIKLCDFNKRCLLFINYTSIRHIIGTLPLSIYSPYI